MPFRFVSNYAVALWSDDLVLLDREQDEFTLIPDCTYEEIEAALQGEIEAHGIATLRRSLIELNVIGPSLEAAASPPAILGTGFFDQRWMLPSTASHGAPIGLQIKALLEVLRANRVIRGTTLNVVCKELERSPPQSRTELCNLDEVLFAANRAFILDTTGNKCLTYSYIVCRMLRAIGLPAEFVVGVRTRPFLSHAWVELAEKVITDDQSVRSNLASIVRV